MAVAIAYYTWAWTLPANTNEADLITAGAGVEYVGTLTICEQSGADVTYRVAVSDNGAGVAADTKHFKRYDTDLLANLAHEIPIHLGPAQTIRVRSGTGSAVSFVLDGMRKTTT